MGLSPMSEEGGTKPKRKPFVKGCGLGQQREHDGLFLNVDGMS